MLYDMTPFYSLYFMNWSQYMSDVTDIAWSKHHLFPNPELLVDISVEWAMGNSDVTMLRSKYKGFDVNSRYMPLGILVYKVLDSLSPDSDHAKWSIFSSRIRLHATNTRFVSLLICWRIPTCS